MTVNYSFEALKALVVEDSAQMRDLLKLMLHAMRIKNVATASDGSEAFEILRRQRPDFVITDLEMLPLDGIEFVRLIRRAHDSPAPYMPVIMLTGYTEIGRVSRARDAGVNEFLAKPITAKALNSRIIEIVERPRPFIKCASYFGPDRRRRDDPYYMGPFRRASDEDNATSETPAPIESKAG